MSAKMLSRRQLLWSAGIAALAVPVLQACGQQAASPTAAPKTEAKPAPASAATKPAAEAKPAATSAPAAAQAKPASGAPVPLSIAVRAEAVRTWQDDVAKKYAQENAGTVNLKIEQVPYAEMDKKQLTWLATGTMPDVVYSGVKWFYYSAYKGAFLALDDLVKSDNYDTTDFFKAAVEGSMQDGKLYAIPHEVNTGNQNIIIYNKDMLAEKGVAEPTDDWTWDEYYQQAAKLTDKSKNVFGTNSLMTNYYDFDAMTRSWGEEILPNEGKEFAFATNPKVVDIARMHTELRTKLNAAPSRDETQGIAFPAGQIALFATGIYNIVGTQQAVGDKFKWDVVLGPTGPDGLRGYEAFLVMYSLYSKTKEQKAAFDLLKYMSSKETAMFAFIEQGQPPARTSIWKSPEAQKINTIWGRAAAWMEDPKNEGPFPIPHNLRFSEFQDKFGNLAVPVFYGEVPFEEGIQKVQAECEQIVKMPRG